MSKTIETEVEYYYYDEFPTKEDLMGDTTLHVTLIQYLLLVLQWLMRDEICAIHHNLNFYQTNRRKEYPVAPDIVVIKGVPHRYLTSWSVGKTGPAPNAIIEVASKRTWRKDVFKKPAIYANMGVREYFTYDPNRPPAWKGINSRLLGWRLDESTSHYQAIKPDARDRLWSEELASWLVPDTDYLRLYDVHDQLRLTGEEAWMQEAEEAEAKAEALARKLREFGFNPDEL